MDAENTERGSARRSRPARQRASRERRLRIAWFVALGLVIASSCGLLFATGTWLTLKLSVQVPDVVIPDVVGRDLVSAQSRLETLGLKVQVGSRRFDSGTAAGRVLEHYPPAGARTKPGRPVRLVVSLGAERIVVPDLTGSSLRRAQLALRAAGLRVARTSSAPSRRIGLGRVVAQNPSAGSEAYPEDAVALLVSSGSPERAFVMPSVAGRSQRRVERGFASAGLRRVVRRDASGDSFIVDQDPMPGARVSTEQRVQLVASPLVIKGDQPR